MILLPCDTRGCNLFFFLYMAQFSLLLFSAEDRQHQIQSLQLWAQSPFTANTTVEFGVEAKDHSAHFPPTFFPEQTKPNHLDLRECLSLRPRL